MITESLIYKPKLKQSVVERFNSIPFSALPSSFIRIFTFAIGISKIFFNVCCTARNVFVKSKNEVHTSVHIVHT